MAVRKFTLTDSYQEIASTPCIITVVSSVDDKKMSIHEGDADNPTLSEVIVNPNDQIEKTVSGSTFAKGAGVIISVNQQGAYA